MVLLQNSCNISAISGIPLCSKQNKMVCVLFYRSRSRSPPSRRSPPPSEWWPLPNPRSKRIIRSPPPHRKRSQSRERSRKRSRSRSPSSKSKKHKKHDRWVKTATSQCINVASFYYFCLAALISFLLICIFDHDLRKTRLTKLHQ